jgi:hypothetical protein
MSINIDRPRSIGLASGTLWLTTASAAFAIWSLASIGTPAAKRTLICAIIVAAALIAAGVVAMRAALRLPRGASPRTAEEGRAIRRQFAWVFGAEIAALAIANPIAAATGHPKLIPSLSVMIIGLHFLPLAWIFRVPRYYVMGLLFCGIPVVMMLSMSAYAHVGHAVGWFVIPGLGCGIVGALTAAAGLRESWKSMAALRLAPQH